MTSQTASVGLVGARGHVGGELVRLLAGHPRLALTRAASRQNVGDRLQDGPVLEDMSPEAVASWPVDVVILALPNEVSRDYVPHLRPDVVAVDLSYDHRFDEPEWAYGLPERTRERIAGARRIANPGCYATGIQLGLGPLGGLLAGPPHAFGVSGYSGAGTTPSPRNDPARLQGNMLPYALTNHQHEREAAHQLGHRLCFTPHVGAWFRGISLTLSAPLAHPTSSDDLHALFDRAYADEPRIKITESIPEVRDIAGSHDLHIGGFAVDDRRAVFVVTLDNLLKGAATQALQNINLALGLPEHLGIPA